MTSTDLFNIIKLRLAKGTPTSVIRFGDGESIILNGKEDVDWVLNRQLGYSLRPEPIAFIQNNMRMAYTDADYIGLPENKRSGLNEYWYRCKEILEKNIGDISERNIVSVDFHNHWLTDGLFDQLLNGLDTLIYISCRELDQRFKERFGIKNIYSYIIAPEMKFTPGYKGERHFPDQYNKIHEWMKTIPVKGNLCLVGSGVIGKIYNTWFKELGGISLDAGNCFDAWAGLVTRGKNRGVGVIDNTYKL